MEYLIQTFGAKFCCIFRQNFNSILSVLVVVIAAISHTSHHADNKNRNVYLYHHLFLSTHVGRHPHERPNYTSHPDVKKPEKIS